MFIIYILENFTYIEIGKILFFEILAENLLAYLMGRMVFFFGRYQAFSIGSSLNLRQTIL